MTKIAFIGAGSVSTALGLYFKNKGFEIQGYHSRNCKSAEKAAQLTNSRAYPSAERLLNESQFIWITTPDDQIKSVVGQISALSVPQRNHKLILHASGVYSLAILAPLKKMGYKTASAHPLLAFSDPDSAQEKLRNVWFTIEKTEENRQLTDLLKACGNRTITVDSDKKALYHAAACVLSNYLVTLLNVSHEIFEKAGLAKDDVQKATTPLLESVIDNMRNKHCKDALTGPIKRNDETTIEMHIESLNAFMPEAAELYKLMGRQTMQMIGNYSLREVLKEIERD